MLGIRNISLKHKLFLGFLMIALLSASFVLLAYPLLYRLERSSAQVVPLVEGIIDIETDLDIVKALEAATDTYLLTQSRQSRQELLRRRDTILGRKTASEKYDMLKDVFAERILCDAFTELDSSVDKLIEASENKSSGYSVNKQAVTTYRLLEHIQNLLSQKQDRRLAQLRNNIKDHNSVIRYLLWGFYAVGGLIILLSVILAYAIARFIVRELSALKNATQAIASGRFDVRIKVNSNDEIGQLAQSFNKMASELLRSTTSVDNLNREISHRQEVETQLLQLNEDLGAVVNRLNESNRELEHLTHVASHDLREPLRKMCCFGHLLSESAEKKLDDDERENLWFVIDAANKMLERIEGIQAYSNIIGQTYSPNVIDLARLVRELMHEDFEDVIKEKRASIKISEPLPKIRGNASQVRILMRHLLSNALQYHNSGVEPKVVISSAGSVDGTVRIEVTDNGIGIRKEDFDKVFTMFGRLHLQNKYKGAGIGLALCRKIVERHGGNIGVSSEYGKGSTFWFTMPAADSSRPKTRKINNARSGAKE